MCRIIKKKWYIDILQHIAQSLHNSVLNCELSWSCLCFWVLICAVWFNLGTQSSPCLIPQHIHPYILKASRRSLLFRPKNMWKMCVNCYDKMLIKYDICRCLLKIWAMTEHDQQNLWQSCLKTQCKLNWLSAKILTENPKKWYLSPGFSRFQNSPMYQLHGIFFVFFLNGIASVSLSQLMESFALKTRQLWMEKWTDCKWETLSVGNRFSQIGYLCKKSETSDEKVLIIEFLSDPGVPGPIFVSGCPSETFLKT